ncbi:MAG TPA: transposase [Ktedonobacteraceae bacterium]|nr:transposase [Ktedonobacteraceae bacterium]
MLILEYKLRANKSQQAAIAEAIRTTQFIRNKALRLWMDGRGVGQYEIQALCSQLAKDYPFAARLNSMARQAAADRAWQSIARFYKNCREQKPGKKGYPRFQKDNRSVEYKTSGWKLEPDGKRLTFTDGHSIGTVRLIGTRAIETFPIGQIKRVRLLKRADGYYVQFAVQAERKTAHEPTGTQVGIDVGLKAFYTNSDGHTVTNPRYFRKAEKRLKRLHRRVSRKVKRSKNRKKASKRLAKGYLKVQRQRKDFAAKAASALVKSHDFIAYEDLSIAHLVKNHRLAKSISDASWGLFLSWVRYYGQIAHVPIVAVSARFTTQDCSGCGYRVKKTLSMRTHVCPSCGLVLDRDYNATLNILAAALVLVVAHNRTAGQAETGTLRSANASGQTTSSGRKRLRSAKLAG